MVAINMNGHSESVWNLLTFRRMSVLEVFRDCDLSEDVPNIL